MNINQWMKYRQVAQADVIYIGSPTEIIATYKHRWVPRSELVNPNEVPIEPETLITVGHGLNNWRAVGYADYPEGATTTQDDHAFYITAPARAWKKMEHTTLKIGGWD
jgi:hypothetical protein